jgi:UDP-glucose 4-epimerase
MKLKKILVTGGAGCIGVPVCNELAKRGLQVVLFDLGEQIERVKSEIKSKKIITFTGSIMDSTNVREAMTGCDGVIHLAAYLGVKRTEDYKLRCLDININGTKIILDAINMNNKVKKVVFASSSEVYGEPVNNPVNEKDITQGKTVYAVSKLTGEELVKAYTEEFKKCKFTILRYFNTYGPFQIAQFVIPKFINLVKNKKRPVINGDGQQIRSFIFSEDTARATVKSLLSNKTNNKILNIGNDNAKVNLLDLANLIIKILKKEKKIKPRILNNFKQADRISKREINIRYCDTTLAKKLIDLKPEVSLENGLKKVIKVGINPDNWSTKNDGYDYSIDEN